MAGDAEHKRGYRTIFRSISQVFYANAKSTNNPSQNVNISNTINNNNNNSNNNNNGSQCQLSSATSSSATSATSEVPATLQISTPTTTTTTPVQLYNTNNVNNSGITVTLISVTKPNATPTSQDLTPSPSLSIASSMDVESKNVAKLRAASSMQNLSLGMALHNGQPNQRIVPVTDILRAQQIQEDNEVQQTQQTTILQRFKSASIGNLTELPGEEDKKSITTQIFKKFNVNRLRINRSPKSEKKVRRSQVNSLFLDDQSKYPLFGSPLNLLELNMTDHPNVPRFVVDVCAYIEQADCIEQDGLYRASGNKLLVDELKRKLTLLYDPRFLQTDDIHTLTSLHKQFFRELSAPLITQEAYERLGRQLNDEGSIERMRLAFDDMPEPNRSTLRFLIKHLTKVAAASALNRMPASNLAIVWGPCLLTANQIQFDIGRMNMLAKLLIENHDRIFRPDNERLVC